MVSPEPIFKGFKPSEETLSQGKKLASELGTSALEHPSISKYASTPAGKQATSFISTAAEDLGGQALTSLFG